VAAILVTGSQGFVGKHLRRALELRHVDVVGVDRPGTGAEVELDLSDPHFNARHLASQLGKIDGVIYMAATITRGSAVDAVARANLRAIADAAVSTFEEFSAKGAHFVYCSTYKTYGPSVGLIDPELPPQRPDPHSYGAAKSLAERLLEIAARRMSVPYAVVRPTCIYGPGQHIKNAIPRFLSALWEGKRPVVFGTGREVRDDVLAADLAYCLAEACLRRESGAFHAAGERARTIFEVAEQCALAVASIGGPSDLAPVLAPERTPKWWLDQEFDLERSRRLLGYEPTLLLEGLKQEAAWIRDGAPQASSVGYGPPPGLGKGSAP
jgi:nucleoside-diphosphate-sugar epimerase